MKTPQLALHLKTVFFGHTKSRQEPSGTVRTLEPSGRRQEPSGRRQEPSGTGKTPLKSER